MMGRLEHQHSDEECDDFETLCHQVGVLWRSPEFDQPSTCKLHDLETHAPPQMRKFKNFALLREEPMEGDHKVDKIEKRIYAAVNNWEKKVELILHRS